MQLTEGSAIPLVAHSWDSGTMTKEPTTAEEGIKTYTCTVCKEKKTEAIRKLTPTATPVPKILCKGQNLQNCIWEKENFVMSFLRLEQALVKL